MDHTDQTNEIKDILTIRSTQHTVMLLKIAAFMWPVWIILDYTQVPNYAFYFGITRVFLGISCLILLLLIKKNIVNDKFAQYFLLVTAYLFVSVMVNVVPEKNILYYFIGATMILIAGFFYLIIPPMRLIPYALILFGSVFISNLYFQKSSILTIIQNGGIMYISIAIFSMGLSILHYKSQIKEITQQLIIKQSNLKLNLQQIQLKEHNEKIEAQSIQLQEQNNILEKNIYERDILLKELHHRVKNNLQIISSLLNLQSLALKDNGIKDALEQSKHRIETMAIIHENLYQSQNFNSLDLNQYLSNLVLFLKMSLSENHKITIDVNIDSIDLKIDQLVPIGLIFNELFTNVIKHAFIGMQSGILQISGIKKEDAYTLKIKDNGVGISKEVHNLNSNTLGFNLIKGLTKQIKGKVFFPQVNQGTEVIIEFPSK